jgi:hypothetical protein
MRTRSAPPLHASGARTIVPPTANDGYERVGGRERRGLQVSPRTVDVCAVLDALDDYRGLVLVDPVHDAEVADSHRPPSLEVEAEGLAHPVRSVA